MAKNLCAALVPIKIKRKELEGNIEEVKTIIEEGNSRARTIAIETMKEVKAAVGI